MIKKLSKSLREYKKESILTVVCMVVEAAMEVLIPLIIFEFGKWRRSGYQRNDPMGNIHGSGRNSVAGCRYAGR